MLHTRLYEFQTLPPPTFPFYRRTSCPTAKNESTVAPGAGMNYLDEINWIQGRMDVYLFCTLIGKAYSLRRLSEASRSCVSVRL